MNRIVASVINRIANQTYTLSRSALSTKLYGGDRDIDDACGYPERTVAGYWDLYKTFGIAKRVVDLMPEECFKTPPQVYETDTTDETTEFEAAYNALDDSLKLNSVYLRADKLSGVGKYGVIFLGLSDVKDPSDIERPVAGTPDLLFVEIKSQYSVSIAEIDQNETSKRYGKPEYYYIDLGNAEDYEITSDDETIKAAQKKTKVHWQRVVHLADNREESNIFGAPRMEPVHDRLWDLKKIPGASAEAVWQNITGQTIYNQDVDSDPLTTEEQEALKSNLSDFTNGLTKQLILQGMEAQKLSPEITNPEVHVKTQLTYIAITLGIPMRQFMGSEQGQLASGQDRENWNSRVNGRRNEYVTPFVIKSFIEHLQFINVLPANSEPIKVRWAPLDEQDLELQAKVAKLTAEALAIYANQGLDMVMSLEMFLDKVMNFTAEEVKASMEMLDDSMTETGVEVEEEGQDEEDV